MAGHNDATKGYTLNIKPPSINCFCNNMIYDTMPSTSDYYFTVKT